MPWIESSWLSYLASGFSGRASRSTENMGIVVAEGHLTLDLDGTLYELGPNDVMAVPGWTWRSMRASEDTVLFHFSDRSAQEKLGIWRRQRCNADPIW